MPTTIAGAASSLLDDLEVIGLCMNAAQRFGRNSPEAERGVGFIPVRDRASRRKTAVRPRNARYGWSEVAASECGKIGCRGFS
jgi:hypothetical protein